MNSAAVRCTPHLGFPSPSHPPPTPRRPIHSSAPSAPGARVASAFLQSRAALPPLRSQRGLQPSARRRRRRSAAPAARRRRRRRGAARARARGHLLGSSCGGRGEAPRGALPCPSRVGAVHGAVNLPPRAQGAGAARNSRRPRASAVIAAPLLRRLVPKAATPPGHLRRHGADDGRRGGLEPRGLSMITKGGPRPAHPA